MNLGDVREALAAALAGLDVELQASPYVLAAPTPPAAWVFPAAIDYDAVMARGADLWTFTVQVFVGGGSDRGAQQLLDRLLAPAGGDSVKAALEDDPTLGGTCEALRVVSATGPRTFTFEGGGSYLGCEWQVELLGDGAAG